MSVVPNDAQKSTLATEQAQWSDPLERDGQAFLAIKGDGSKIWVGPRGGVKPADGSDPVEEPQGQAEFEEPAPPEPEPEPEESDLPAPDTDGLGEEPIEGTGTELEPFSEEIAESMPDIPRADDGAMLVPHGDTPYELMDRADEIAILNEIAGRTLESMLYEYEQGGEKIIDLSINGVSETVRLMNERGGCQIGIARDVPPKIEEFTEDGKRYLRAMVFAQDSRFPESGRWGLAIEPRMMSLKKGGEKWDIFAETKAMNKAERNAMKKLIPEEFRQTIIATKIGTQAAVQRIKPIGGGKVAEKDPLMDERALTIKAEITALFEELQSINAAAMNRGVFNAFLAAAERESHTRLEQFREHVRSMLEDVKGKVEA